MTFAVGRTQRGRVFIAKALMLAHADRNMYQAKLSGRNRVVYQSLQAASASDVSHAETSAQG